MFVVHDLRLAILVLTNPSHQLASLGHPLVAHLQIWDNPQAPETQWYIRGAGGDTFNIVNVKSGKCLNVAGASPSNGPCTS